MSLQCSIFGHKYGGVVTERERRQDGSEVIVTEREVKTCTRCGDELVVSENKEVRTVEAAGDVPGAGDIGSDSHGETTGPSPGAGEATGPSPGVGETTTEPPPDAGETPPSNRDDATGQSVDTGDPTDEAASDAASETASDAAGGTSVGSDAGGDASAAGGLGEMTDRATGDDAADRATGDDAADRATGDDASEAQEGSSDKQIPDAETGEEMGPEPRKDDAIILDDDSEERDPGEWPSDWPDDDDSTTDVAEDPPVEWPEETEAAASGDAGAMLGDAGAASSDAGADGRDASSDPEDETEVLKDDLATTGSDGNSETVTGAARGDAAGTDEERDEPAPDDPDIEPTKSALTIPEGEFYCPECGFTSDVEDSPLREGDFCPRCHEAALEHRAE